MTGGLIVVGLDGSEESKAALRWAMEEARLRGAAVRVVHAWTARPVLLPGAPLTAGDWELVRRDADEFAHGLVADTIGSPSDLELTVDAVHGLPAGVLVQAAKGAELLVVGSRGHGGFAGLLLGSVSQQCLHHAPCPVVIVRGTATEKVPARERAPGVEVTA